MPPGRAVRVRTHQASAASRHFASHQSTDAGVTHDGNHFGPRTAPTTHARLLRWVRETAELTQPDRVEWVDGSPEEWTRITDQLVENGTFVRLNPEKKPNSFWCASDPTDVARVEDRTFICSRDPTDAGPTNNWMDPDDMKAILTERFRGSMRGRTMYVIPYCMGPLTADEPMLGVGDHRLALRRRLDAHHDPAGRQGAGPVHRRRRRAAVRARPALGRRAAASPASRTSPWPCNDTKYIVHFPEERLIWSYGSGYGGNALLGKKCYSLRIASVKARDEGWLAEHMLIAKLTSPEQQVLLHRRGVPVRVRQDQPGDARADACRAGRSRRSATTSPGCGSATDGRLYAVNPENGFFGVAPGHRLPHQPERDAHDRQGQLDLHQRRADRRRRHLVGGHAASRRRT